MPPSRYHYLVALQPSVLFLRGSFDAFEGLLRERTPAVAVPTLTETGGSEVWAAAERCAPLFFPLGRASRRVPTRAEMRKPRSKKGKGESRRSVY